MKPAKAIRIFAIIQLCIVFTLLVSALGYPFLREVYLFRTKSALYNTVTGQQKFMNLPQAKQIQIQDRYAQLQKWTHRPFLEKLGDSFNVIFLELPPMERLWIVLAIVIPILLLLGVEGTQYAVWLLPLVTLVYGIHNVWHGHEATISPEVALFPTEKIIVEEYLKEPLSPHIHEQRDQLLRGWKFYLVDKWAHAKPSDEIHVFNAQVEEGEYAFHVKQLEVVLNEDFTQRNWNNKQPIGMLILYLLWNICFAFFTTRSLTLNYYLIKI